MTDTANPRWYLDIMSPNTKGEKFAWLDPTSIYINGDAFTQLLDDLTADLEGVDCDVVAGLDAMGFVLGAALATRIGVGFLPIRKAGKLCVDTDSVSFTNYSGRTQDMEMRTPAFAAGTRVLLVDQWIETGGQWMAPFALSNAKGALLPALPPSPWKTMTAQPTIARPILSPQRFSLAQTSRHSATARHSIHSLTTNRKWLSRE